MLLHFFQIEAYFKIISEKCVVIHNFLFGHSPTLSKIYTGIPFIVRNHAKILFVLVGIVLKKLEFLGPF